jgi:hypothetical protein
MSYFLVTSEIPSFIRADIEARAFVLSARFDFPMFPKLGSQVVLYDKQLFIVELTDLTEKMTGEFYT